MTSPVKSTCFPADNQTLFLGCSVMSFSLSAGLNGQVSELTVQLVEDDCPAEVGKPKKFRDCLLREQDWNDEDPGFFGELISIIGTPVYFRIGDFEYAGLVQGWERVQSQSGNPTYEVKITDPRILLENTRIIMNDDTGIEPSVIGYGVLDNVYNALYWNEKERPGVGVPCPPTQQFLEDGVIAGSLADWYGAADHNRNGLAWDDVIWMIESRINSVNRTDYIRYLSSGGSVVHPTFGTITGMGLLDETQGLGGYAVDITEIPDVPIYYRFDQTEASLMDLLNQVIEDSGCDYYVELVPAPFPETTTCAGYAGSSNKYDLIIKIRCIDRRTQVATTGSIETFVNATTNQDRVISYNEGRELRNDITKSMIMGGAKQSIWQADNGVTPGSIIPYFGLDPNTKDVLIPTQNGLGYWRVTMPTNDLAMQLSSTKYGVTIPATLLVTEEELIIAQGGFDSWHSWVALGGSALYNSLSAYVTSVGVFDLEAINQIFDILDSNPLNDPRTADFINASRRGFQGHDNMELEILNIAYSWINKIATEYYGKMFQVLAPFTCTKISIEAQAFLNTEEPTDGGWTEASPIVGLVNPSTAADFFRLEDERFGPFVGFNVGAVELSNLAQDSYITDGVRVWIKVNQEQEYVFLDHSSQSGPRIVISLPQQIRKAEDTDTIQLAFNELVKLAAGFDPKKPTAADQTKLNDILKKVGSVGGHEGVLNHAIVPDGAAVAIKSNLLRYGPWAAAGLGTTGGDTNIKVEEGLVPWEYAGYALMNTAGTELSAEGITKQQVIDKGTVTVHGYPDLPLGAEILAIENGTLAGTQLFENRSAQARVTLPIRSNASNQVVNKVNMLASGSRWTGADGANITTITTRVGPQGTQTTYAMRVFTDKFGRFAKLNAKRLKTIGKWRLALTRYFRAFNRYRLGLLRQQILNSILRPAIIINSRWGAGSRTPHEVIVGQLGVWNNDTYQRPFVADMPIHEAAVEISEEYTEKAFMSIDGLIRPVSVKGLNGGHLPKFANPINGCQMTASRGAQPPIDKQGEAGNFSQYNLDTSIDYLNPFANPNTEVPGRTDTPNHGHDIELLGRGSVTPTGSMMMAPGGYLENGDFAQNDYSSDDDYRGFALRGPLLLQSWGYDLDGFPIPNTVDSEANAKAGTFQSANLQHKFLDQFLRKSETWPVAPVDLRFDRERAVWTIPQYRDLVVQLTEDLSGGSGLAKRIEGPTLYDSGGNVITQPELYIQDKLNCSNTPLKSGDKAIVRFDPEACEYYIIEACSSGEGTPICAIDVNCCISNDNRALNTCISGESGVGIQKFGFANGLRAFTGASGDCPDAGSSETGACCDLAPDLYLMAGSKFIQGSFCRPEVASGTVDFANEIQVGDGLKLGVPASQPDCKAQLSAGIEIAVGNTDCIETNDPMDFVNLLTLGRGLRGTPITGTILNTCDYVMSAGFEMQGTDGSGLTEITSNAFTNKLVAGSGIEMWSNLDPCTVVITATGAGKGVYATGSETCITGNYQGLDCFKTIEFAKGLHVKDVNILGPDPKIQVGAGFSFTNKDECINPTASDIELKYKNDIKLYSGIRAENVSDCLLNIGAGIFIKNDSGCIDTASNIPFASTLELADGIRSEAGASDCIGKLGAGLDFTNDSGCINDADVSNVDFANKIKLADGIRASGDEPNCTVALGAGINISQAATCVTGTDANTFANKIELGQGLYAKNDGTDECKMTLGAGLTFASGSACLTGTMTDSPGYVNYVQVNRGLRADWGGDPSPCDVRLGAGFAFVNNSSTGNGIQETSLDFINHITVGSGIEMYTGADGCSVILSATGSKPCIMTSDQCITGDLTDCTKFNKLELGKGLHAKVKGSFFTVDDHVQVGAGFAFTNAEECIKYALRSSTDTANDIKLGYGLFGGTGVGATDCDYTITAGLHLTNNSTCYSGGSVNGTQEIYPRINFGAGLNASGDEDNCLAGVSAGFSTEHNSTCYSGGTDSSFFNHLLLGKGLRGSGIPSTCNFGMSAGFEATNPNSLCIKDSTQASGAFINALRFERGIWGSGNECELHIGAGMDLYNGTQCVEETNDMLGVNKFTMGAGLRVTSGTNGLTGCDAIIGAGMEFSTTANACIQTSHTHAFANKILLGKGLYSNTGSLGTPCEIELAAGITTKNTGGCITGDMADTTAAHTIRFLDGLRTKPNQTLACESEVSAGLNFINSHETGTSTSDVAFANKIYVGSGLAATESGDCGVLIWGSGGGGIEWCSTDTCVTQNDTACTGNITKIQFAKGIWKQDGTVDPTLINIGAGFSYSNTEDAPATGDVTFANTIKIGYGLGVATGAPGSCEAIIFSTGVTEMSGCSTPDCVTVNDAACTGFRKITFGLGINKENVETDHIRVGAGISGGNDTGCFSSSDVTFFNQLKARDGIKIGQVGGQDGDCQASIGAGIALTNYTGECFTGANAAFANKINLGRGLRVGETLTSCQASIIAGPRITGEDFCKPSALGHTPVTAGGADVDISNDLHIGSGLQVAAGSEECSSYWAAGMYFDYDETECPFDWSGPDTVDFANHFKLIGKDDKSNNIGWGLTGTTGVGDCEIMIAQGNQLNDSDKCVKSPMDRRWINQINIGRGLTVGSGDGDLPCEATIDLNLDIDGKKGQKVILAGGCKPTATEQADGDCTNILLTFGDSGTLTVVTDVTFGECDVIVHQVPITFCGTTGALSTGSRAQLTDCSGDLGCPCPTGTG